MKRKKRDANDLCAKHVIFLSFVESTRYLSKCVYCDRLIVCIYVWIWCDFFFIISKACKIFKINSMWSYVCKDYFAILSKKMHIVFFYDMELDKIIPVDKLWCHNIVWFLAYCPRKQQYQSFIQLDICNWRALYNNVSSFPFNANEQWCAHFPEYK